MTAKVASGVATIKSVWKHGFAGATPYTAFNDRDYGSWEVLDGAHEMACRTVPAKRIASPVRQFPHIRSG